MASYNELLALIDAYINQNGVQAITGQVLNGVLRAMVDQLGRGYTIMGTAVPSTDPGTPDGPESWFASTPGTYTDMGGLTVANAELALLSYTPSDGWAKTTLTQGIVSTSASVDDTVGTPSVTSSYVNGVLTFEFHNLKGNTGDPAGFGAVTASVDDQIGTPSVQVQTSGPDTAKAMSFQFHNLKGETGVTSVVATVDNTTGTPTCSVSLVGQELHLDFTGLKGVQGDTGVSADYPITIANNLTTNDPTAALSAAMGVQLESEVSQLELEVNRTNVQEEGFYLVDANLNIGLAFRGGKLIIPTKYNGKKISFLGDSITTFGVPDQNNATGTWTYPGNRCRYPQNNLFTDVKYCWWKRLLDKLGASLGINESWAGSRVSNTSATDTGDVGPNRCISSLTRIGHLDDNGTPDIIIVYAGTNDIGNNVTIGTFDTTSPKDLTEEQIASLDVTTFANAYRAMLIRLQYYYQNSRIIVCLPNFTNTYYTMSELDNYIEVIREACDYFGVEYIDLRASGITIYNRGTYLPDGIHPNADGMELLFNKVYNYLMEN